MRSFTHTVRYYTCCFLALWCLELHPNTYTHTYARKSISPSSMERAAAFGLTIAEFDAICSVHDRFNNSAAMAMTHRDWGGDDNIAQNTAHPPTRWHSRLNCCPCLCLVKLLHLVKCASHPRDEQFRYQPPTSNVVCFRFVIAGTSTLCGVLCFTL